ncbi:leucine-rich repeat protein [Candidatus Saccharibacteria bacterium]|nr:leucine-rich repeat protein [Candidatus Saccharibacteria bacterium]
MASVFVSTLISGKAFAAQSAGLITGEDGTRWTYILTNGGIGTETAPETLEISFYDKPADATTVKVPSLSFLKTNVQYVSNNLNTYFLKDADVAAQDATYGTGNRIVTSTPTTVLDMSDTAKIQILGVKPIIDPDVETELIFGSNMVLGDSMAIRIEGVRCSSFYRDGDNYVCNYNWDEIPYVVEDASGRISGWASMSAEERAALEITPEIVGYGETTIYGTVPANEYDSNKTYFRNRQNGFGTGHGDYKGFAAYKNYVGRAFSGYKIKLTNFKASNFNYVGWGTFEDSIFADDSTTITVDGNSFNGGDIFKNTNVKNIVINTDHYGVGLFRDCQSIENVSFGENATYLQDDTFAGTNLTSVDFAGTNMKRIGARAFESAQLTQVNFGNMERIDYRAFRGNDIKELYLPKSINYLQSGLFTQNQNLKKITIAYDTLSSGTTLPFWVVVGGGGNDGDDGYYYNYPLEEVNIIAPYAANEPVSATHVTYDDYRWGFDTHTQEHTGGRQPNNWGANSYGYAAGSTFGDTYMFEDDFANYDAYKNILAPLYFSNFDNLKKITIGEGYEFIGSSAFWYDTFLGINWPAAQALDGTCNGQMNCGRYLEKIQLPETLKAVGNLAFQGSYAVNIEVNLPKSLEFIGVSAFQELYHMGGDFDLPNLKYLGDFAFNGTSLRDITIHDTLEYWGVKAFTNDLFVRNITIDCDIFSPDKYVPWATEDYSRTRDSSVIPSNEFFRLQFGYYTGEGITSSNWGPRVSVADAERWGIDERSYLGQSAWSHFGKITFTNKVVHMMAMMDHNSDSTSSTDSFFGQTSADEIDMSGMPWKILPRKFFNRIHVGKISLPQNLEIIGHHAFVNTQIDEELVMPDSVKIIGSHAFEQEELAMKMKNCHYVSSIGSVCERDDSLPTIKITKLPTSLEYVGNVAFWGDLNMTADLNAPNLKYIGSRAFMYTGIRDVLLPNGLTMLREGAFALDANLRNITIDTNLSDIYTTAAERHGPDDYVFPSYFVEWAGNAEEARIEIDSKALTSDCEWFDEQMANGYFDQHPENLQYQSAECIDDKPFETFYTIFNKQEEVPEYYTSYYQIKVKEGQVDSGDTYGTLTFGPHATVDLNNTSDGVFAGLNFDTVDLSQAGWKSLSTHINAFYKSKIGTLILPGTLETINGNAFMRGEITNPVTFPASLRTVKSGAFQWAKIGGLNIEEGLKTIERTAFLWSEIGGQFAFPTSLETIGDNSFMEAKGFITNMLPANVKTIGSAAFYQSDMADELVIPAGVTLVGDSAFLTNNVDVHYDKVTIKPYDLATVNGNRLVFQMLLNNDIDELIVESTVLAASAPNRVDAPYNEEFTKMTMTKATLTNVPVISRSAFEKCRNLVEVDLSQDANLRDIKTEAFLDAEKLHIIKFSPALKNETVNVGQRAFVNTAFETMGDSTKEFDLTAAKFNATTQGLAFAWMPKLRTLDIPRNFSNNTIPVATFYNDTNLEEVTIDYKITLIDNGAFVNDTKIKKVFIWGNTVVKNDGLEGYTAPEWFGQGGDDDDDTDADPVDPVDPATLTIPGQADIYAYSVSPTEAYAGFTRNKPEVTGTFYPLDEVLYLTSNKPTVLLNDDESDFDKSDLIVYGLRRDGLVLESDEWAQYDGVVYPRSARPLTFEKMAATVAADPAFGTVYDTPVPLNELNIGNENFAAIDFAIVPAVDDPAVRIVNIVYTDGYTGGEPDTDIDPRQVTPDPTPVIPDEPDDPVEPDNPVNPDEPEPEPEPQPEPQPEPETPEEPKKPDTPVTNDELGRYIAIFSGSFAAGLGLIGWKLLSSRKRR